MKDFVQRIPLYLAFGFLFFLNSIIVFYHICVMLGYIPISLIYGGKIKTSEEMFLYESISLLANLIILGIIYIKKRMIIQKVENSIINMLIYSLCGVFMFVSIANLIAFNIVEILIAVPYTFISVVLCWRLNLQDDGTLIIKDEHLNGNVNEDNNEKLSLN